MTLALAAATTSLAQQQPAPPRERSQLDATRWGVVYDVPATKQVTLRADVPYMRDAAGTLALDIYLPPGLKTGETRPAVVFLNAIGDRPGDKVKNWEIYKTWPRLVAAHGLVGISMDADPARVQESLRAVFNFLAERGAEQGVDARSIGVYAASANVRGASEYLMGEGAATGVRAAVLYYGQPPEQRPRQDLPVLFVVAESDAPGMRPQLASLWQRVVETNAPWTLAFASRLPHAFDAFADNDGARRVIRQTIEFWKSHLEPVPVPPWRPSPAREIVASMFGNDQQQTADLLAKWIATHPDDAQAHAAHGRALQQVRRLNESAAAYERAYALDPDNAGIAFGLGQVRMGQRRFEDAAQLIERAIGAGMRNGFTYGQLALVQLQLDRNEEAVKSYEKALEAGIPPGANTRGVAWYNLACAHAKLGRKEKALDALARAVDEGFSDRATLESDPDLASVRSEPRFRDIAARLAAPRP